MELAVIGAMLGVSACINCICNRECLRDCNESCRDDEETERVVYRNLPTPKVFDNINDPNKLKINTFNLTEKE
jgi:hypothetical protein